VTAGVWTQDGFVIQRTAERLGPGYIVELQQGTCRRDERDAATACESWRSNERF
jgi:hypothetical protein